jgi:hypothetical protein
MDREAEIAKAFKYFQDAARNRDLQPEIFEGARIRYYSLKNGDAWLEQEKKRLQTEKLQPVIQEYKNQYDSLDSEAEVQKGYTDSIASIRDKQSALNTGISGNLTFLQNLLQDKQTKLSNYNRYVELTTPGYSEYVEEIKSSPLPIVSYFAGFPSSFNIILDVFIGFLILFALLLILRKVRPATTSFFSSFIPTSSRPTSSASPTITISSPSFSPARTATLIPR